jgi:tRNA pseudouridine65 synthase
MLPILYQDQDLIVVNKYSGLLVHRSAIDAKAEEFAVQMLRDQLGQKVYPVHRLDRPTSGALVFAFSSESARHLSQEFSEGRVKKTYLAVVRGVSPSEVIIDYPLKEELDKLADKKAREDKPAQNAITQISTLASIEIPIAVDKFPTSRYSLVKAVPKTGRKHQIRRHLRHLGHPIIGDVSHGSGKHNRFFRDHFQIPRLLLACTEISFLHPKENTFIRVQAPLSEDFKNLIEKLGWGHAH